MKLPKFTINGKHEPTIQDEWGLKDQKDSNKKDKGKKHAKKKDQTNDASN